MKLFKKLPPIILTIIAICALRTGIAYSALKASYKKALEIAFMNGYVTATRLDIEDIKKLKADQSLLRSMVNQASIHYLEQVSEMNKAE